MNLKKRCDDLTRPITYCKCNRRRKGRMEKLEVKYEPSFPTDRMMKFERMPDDEDNDDVGFHGTTKKAGGKDKKNGWVSFVLASLALVTGLVLLTLVITWLWGIPELVSRHSRLFKEMADRLETQADQIRELERKIGEIGSSQHLKVSSIHFSGQK